MGVLLMAGFVGLSTSDRILTSFVPESVGYDLRAARSIDQTPAPTMSTVSTVSTVSTMPIMST